MFRDALSDANREDISRARGSLAKHQIITKKRNFAKSRLAMCEDGRVILARYELGHSFYGSVRAGEIYLQLREHVDECQQCLAAQPGQYRRDARRRVNG